MIRYCRKLNPEAIIIVMGCFAEANPTYLEGIDIRVGNTSKSKVLELLEEYQKTKEKQLL